MPTRAAVLIPKGLRRQPAPKILIEKPRLESLLSPILAPRIQFLIEKKWRFFNPIISATGRPQIFLTTNHFSRTTAVLIASMIIRIEG